MAEGPEICGICKEICGNQYPIRCAFCQVRFDPACLGLNNESLALLIDAMDKLSLDYFCPPCKEKISGFSVKYSEECVPEENSFVVFFSPLEDNEREERDNLAVDLPGNENFDAESHMEINVPSSGRREISNENQVSQENTEDINIRTEERNPETSNDRVEMGNSIKNTNEVCKFHVNGGCRYNEENCKFKHPELCRRYTAYGDCKFKERCRFYHHQICKFVSQGRFCKFEKHCSYLHPKKTTQSKAKLPMHKNYHEENISDFRSGRALNFFQEMYDMMMHMKDWRVNSRMDHIPWKRESPWRNY